MAKEKATVSSAARGIKKLHTKPLAHAVGRRKSSVARVWLRSGNGLVRVNGKTVDAYFDTDFVRQAAMRPFAVCPVATNYDVQASVNGGGKNGQADAVKLAISRAFVELDETLKPALRAEGLLTVDSRNKERKKYGQKAARRKFQFVKR